VDEKMHYRKVYLWHLRMKPNFKTYYFAAVMIGLAV